MTVRELIERLEYCNQDVPVYVGNESTELEIKSVEQTGIYSRVILKIEKE